MSFGDRVFTALRERGPLCVGIDPHPGLLREWGLDATAAGTREFGLRVVEATVGRAAFVKPQVAFFERYGSGGYAALEDVMAAARAARLVVIADAKRGDIGTTMDAYAAAWLTPGEPLEADALTVSPYLGVEALDGCFDLARSHGKGVFVLAATSNPEARHLQSAPVGRAGQGSPPSVAEYIAREIAQRNAAETLAWHAGSVGVVIGATVDWSAVSLSDDQLTGVPILAPGFGAQGAEPATLPALFGSLAGQVIASESRSILSAGPDGIAARIRERASLYGG